ncbi:MAG: winged helix-turn-helix domain-containing protein [Bacillota bacterium]
MAKTFAGIGKDAIKTNNISAILSCVYTNAPISRRDIAKMVHLTPPTVTLLVAELLQCRLLRECGEVNEGTRAGRRVVELDFNPYFGYLLGVCIEPSGLSFALTYFCGRTIEESLVIDRMTIENSYSQEELLPELLKLADDFLGRQKTLQGRFCAVGISLSGPVDPGAGVSLNS